MPSDVYKALINAGFKGTEQEMFRTFAFEGTSSTAIGTWNWSYNVLSSSTIVGTVLTSNGAGVAPTWQAPVVTHSYDPSGW